MDIKDTIVGAKVVIESLICLLENENVDISSIKFKVGSQEEKYESKSLSFESLVDLTLKELDAAKAQIPQWIDVNKLTPQHDIKVLVSFGDDCQPEFDHLITDADENDVFADYGDEVTHWMSLPKLPHEIREQSHD